MVYFGGFFAKLEFSRGFLSVYHVQYNAGGISAAAMTGDIIFFSLAGPEGDYTGPILCFFTVFFSILYSPEGLAKLAWAERRSGGT